MQDATENCHYLELVGEPLRLEQNFTFPQEHVTEHFVAGKRMFSVAVDKFGVVGKSIRNQYCSSPSYNSRGSFPSDFVPTLDNDTYAIIITQHGNMQGEHWILIRKSCQIL